MTEVSKGSAGMAVLVAVLCLGPSGGSLAQAKTEESRVSEKERKKEIAHFFLSFSVL